jgi:hypothetical protein
MALRQGGIAIVNVIQAPAINPVTNDQVEEAVGEMAAEIFQSRNNVSICTESAAAWVGV